MVHATQEEEEDSLTFDDFQVLFSMRNMSQLLEVGDCSLKLSFSY